MKKIKISAIIITVLLSCFLLCSTAFAEDAVDTSSTGAQEQGTTLPQESEKTTQPKVECVEHDFAEQEVVAPTCEKYGYTKHQCKNCSYVYYDYIKVPQHQIQKTEAKSATCSQTGNNEYYTCSRCNKAFKDKAGKTVTTVEAETIASLGHQITKTEAKSATCSQTGNNEYYTCSRCNKVFKDEAGSTETTVAAETIAALGHQMTKTEAKSATCSQTGNNEYYTCSRCNKVFKDEAGSTETTAAAETIAALGHQMTKTEAKSATCSQTGNNEYYACSRCNKVFKDEAGSTETTVAAETIAALSHQMTKTEAKNACTQAGNNEYYTCSRCNKVFKDEAGSTETTVEAETIATLGHQMTKTEAKSATCSQVGNNEYYTCSRCNKVFKDEAGNTETTVAAETIAALGHQMTKTKAKSATCTQAGNNEYYTCSRCNKVFKDEAGSTETTVAAETIAALGHNMTKTKAKKATCEAAGNNEYYTCLNCRKIFKDTNGEAATTVKAETIKALGHKLTTRPNSWNLKQKTAKIKCDSCKKNVEVKISVKESNLKKATLSKNGSVKLRGSVKVNSKTYTTEKLETIYSIKTVSLTGTSFNYNGKVQKPALTVKDSQGNVIASNYYKVTYSNASSKNLGKYTVTVKFSGKYSGEKTLSYSIILSKTTNLKANGRTLTWNNVRGAKQYEVYIYNSAKKAYQKVATVSKNEYKLGKDWKCGSYKAYVVAVNGKTKSEKSSVVSFKCAHNWNKNGANCLDCNTVDTVKKYTKVVMTPNKYKVNEKYKSTLTLYVEGKNHNYTLSTTAQPNGFTTKTTGTKTIVFTAYDGVKCNYTVTK